MDVPDIDTFFNFVHGVLTHLVIVVHDLVELLRLLGDLWLEI